MGDDALANVIATYNKARRATLIPDLPRLLATYFNIHGKQPESASDPASPRELSQVTETDLHKQSGKETSLQEDWSRNANSDNSDPSLDGFFDWLDVEADMGKYAGRIERTPDSRLEFLREFIRTPIGSGVMGQPLNRRMCCNNTESNKCPHAADLPCKACQLVAYCSNYCGHGHSKFHKLSICDSLQWRGGDIRCPLQEEILELSKELPQRENEDHADAEICNPILPFYGLLDDLDTSKEPLLLMTSDIPNISTDEKDAGKASLTSQNPSHGLLFPDQVCLLFPAVYDLRNIFQTVCNIPDGYTGSITLFLNCAQAKLAVRDFLILELLRYHGAAAIDLAIGLWYSTAITATQDAHLMLTILRMLDTWESSLSATGAQHTSATYKQPFPPSTKGSSLRADFGTQIWSELRELVSNDECNRRGFHPEEQYPWRWGQDDSLKATACDPRNLASWSTFQRQGLFLPYGVRKDSFNTPNRFRYSWKSDRIARYRNDPASGWSIPVAQTRENMGLADLYGELFFRLRELMEVFLRRTANCCVQLRLMQFQTRKLFQILKTSGMKFHRIDACGLYHDKEVSPEVAMEWCAGLLAEDASPAWPSILLTATLREQEGKEAHKKGLEAKKSLMSTGEGPGSIGPKPFWNYVEPVTVWAYKRVFEAEEFTTLSSNEEAGIKDKVRHVAATFGLHKQRRHRIVSPVPGVPLKHTRHTPAFLARFYVDEVLYPYFNIVFSGFTFQELFHEWGWDPGVINDTSTTSACLKRQSEKLWLLNQTF